MNGTSLKDLYIHYIKRLLIIFIGWSFIYSLPRLSSDLIQSIVQYGWLRTYYWHFIDNFASHPAYLLMTGTVAHLWFLSALLQALTLLVIFIAFKKEKTLIYFSALLYLLTPLVNLYFQIGTVEDYTYNPVVGLFVSLIFVTSGWWLSKRKNFLIEWGVAIFVMGMVISWGQGKFVTYFYQIDPVYYVYGNLLMAVGVFIMALSYPKFCENTVFPRLGQLTLGVYCSHILFVDLFKMFKEKIDPLAWDFIVPILIYLMALGLTLLLRQIPFLRKLVI